MSRVLMCLLTLGMLITVASCSTKRAEYDEEPAPNIYYSMDVFLEEWHLEEEGVGNRTNTLDHVDGFLSVTVPVLKNSNYIFYFAEKNEYTYIFYYVPKNFSSPSFEYESGIVVYMSRENGSFSAVMDQQDLVAEDGIAYDESNNEWHMDVDGKSLSVLFPESLPVTTEEELYSYFEFEEYTVSGNSGEVQ